MAITILEFGDVAENGSSDPIYPAKVRRENLPVATFHALSDMTRGVLVYTTTAVHLRVTTNNAPGNEATQYDPLIAADGTAYFLVQRKARGTDDKLFIYAATDT